MNDIIEAWPVTSITRARSKHYSGEYCRCGVHACGVIQYGSPCPNRTIASLIDRHESRGRLNDIIEAWPVTMGTVLAKCRNRNVNELRVFICQRLVVKAVIRHGAWAIVLYKDIGLLNQLANQRAAAFSGYVEDNAAFPRILSNKAST